MAVQQNKKSPSKRGMHRSHDALTAPSLSVDSVTGEVHRPHHISPNGMYRGRKVVKARILPCNAGFFTLHPNCLTPCLPMLQNAAQNPCSSN